MNVIAIMNRRAMFLGVAMAAVVALAAGTAEAASYWWDTTGTGLWSSSEKLVDDGPRYDQRWPSGLWRHGDLQRHGRQRSRERAVKWRTGIAGMTFANTGTTLIDAGAAGSQTLTVGTSGITINAGRGAVTIGDPNNQTPITMNGTQQWTNNSSNVFTVVNAANNGGNTLTIAGSGTTSFGGGISGGGGLTTTGAGGITLSGNTSYTGADPTPEWHLESSTAPATSV